MNDLGHIHDAGYTYMLNHTPFEPEKAARIDELHD